MQGMSVHPTMAGRQEGMLFCGHLLYRAGSTLPVHGLTLQAPEAASGCRAHRNLLCPIRASPPELRARACACPARRVTPVVPEGLGEGNGKTTGQILVRGCKRLRSPSHSSGVSRSPQELVFDQACHFLSLLLL